MGLEYQYDECPEMPEEVCVQCPKWDHLNDSCYITQIGVLTKRLSCDTIDESFNLEGGTA